MKEKSKEIHWRQYVHAFQKTTLKVREEENEKKKTTLKVRAEEK